MIVILWDSLRLDSVEPLKDIFEKETWSSYETIETFTAPVIASTMTGKTPEELGIKRDFSSFFSSLDQEVVDDTLFDHFDSHLSVGRLIGNGPADMPPARRDKARILPPIEWNAVSNWDPDILQYIGRKWSEDTDDWWDLIYWHSFVTHAPFSTVTGEGAKECPEVMNTSRLMKRIGQQDPEALKEWYMKGVKNAVCFLRGIDNICGDKETIICFADHGEALREELDGQPLYGHAEGMKKIPEVGKVPIWINKDEEIPDDINNLNLKDWIVEMYEKYEKGQIKN